MYFPGFENRGLTAGPPIYRGVRNDGTTPRHSPTAPVRGASRSSFRVGLRDSHSVENARAGIQREERIPSLAATSVVSAPMMARSHHERVDEDDDMGYAVAPPCSPAAPGDEQEHTKSPFPLAADKLTGLAAATSESSPQGTKNPSALRDFLVRHRAPGTEVVVARLETLKTLLGSLKVNASEVGAQLQRRLRLSNDRAPSADTIADNNTAIERSDLVLLPTNPRYSTTSLDPRTQAYLYVELELQLTALANAFLLDAWTAGALEQSTLSRLCEDRKAHGLHHVPEFQYDFGTQGALVDACLSVSSVETSRLSRGLPPVVDTASLRCSWRRLASVLVTARIFCHPDAHVRAHLADAYVVAESLGMSSGARVALDALSLRVAEAIAEAGRARFEAGKRGEDSGRAGFYRAENEAVGEEGFGWESHSDTESLDLGGLCVGLMDMENSPVRRHERRGRI